MIFNFAFRISEPFVFSKVKQQLGIKIKKKQIAYSEQTLSHFLQSAMNIEYVCLILTSLKTVL